MQKIIFILVLFFALCGKKVYGQYVWVAQDNNTHYVDVEFRINLENPVLLTSEHQPALTYLSMVIDTYRDKIESGEWKVWVESYVKQPRWSIGQNRAVAKVTSNVVKSYMIYSEGLQEVDFITKNYSGTLNKRQGVTSVIVGARYPLDRMLPIQRIDWDANDLVWLTETARTNPRVEVEKGRNNRVLAPDSDTIQIALPDFEPLTFTYRHSNSSEWKGGLTAEAQHELSPQWQEVSTDRGMDSWGLSGVEGDDHLDALEAPLLPIQYNKLVFGTSTKLSASQNDEALAEIGAMIQANRAALQKGESFIYLDSYVYGDSLAPASARAQARIQSNILKSYLVANYGVSESQFSTRNHSGLFDNQSAITMVTVAKQQPVEYMSGFQTIDSIAHDRSWKPGPARTRYSRAYAAQEKAQMEFVNEKLSGLDLNALTEPWSTASIQEGASEFVVSAPTMSHQALLPAGGIPLHEATAVDESEGVAAQELGYAEGVVLEEAVESKQKKTKTKKPARVSKRAQSEIIAVVGEDGKITIDATAFQQKLTDNAQSQLAQENRAVRRAEERAVRESQVFERRAKAVAAQKAKGRFAVFGVGFNALSSVALIPSIQLDAYFSDRFSAIVEGYYSNWNFSPENKINLQMLSSELRYFPMGKIKQFSKLYIGAYGAFGSYNLCWNGKATGHQSHFWSAGLSAGYVLPLGKSPFYLDMGIAGGYVYESVERYLFHQGHNYFLEQYTNSTIFPVKAKVSIVCRIFNERR